MRVAVALLCLLCLCAFTGDTRQVYVTVTAYSRFESGPRTASGKPVRVGFLAVSRDIERLLGLRFGDHVTLGGVPYVFEDRMARRWTRRVDIFAPSYQQAKEFGIKHQILLARVPVGAPAPSPRSPAPVGPPPPPL